MKHQTFLQQFTYSIPATSLTFAGPLKKQGRKVATHLPLLKVELDFTNGKMNLDADWHFLSASNCQINPANFFIYRERVKVEAFLNSSIEIDLEEKNCDGLIFPFEGNINDGSIQCSCSGLIILDAGFSQNPSNAIAWMMSIYLYDALVENFEIKLKLPLFYTSVSSINN